MPETELTLAVILRGIGTFYDSLNKYDRVPVEDLVFMDANTKSVEIRDQLLHQMDVTGTFQTVAVLISGSYTDYYGRELTEAEEAKWGPMIEKFELVLTGDYPYKSYWVVTDPKDKNYDAENKAIRFIKKIPGTVEKVAKAAMQPHGEIRTQPAPAQVATTFR